MKVSGYSVRRLDVGLCREVYALVVEPRYSKGLISPSSSNGKEHAEIFPKQALLYIGLIQG